MEYVLVDLSAPPQPGTGSGGIDEGAIAHRNKG